MYDGHMEVVGELLPGLIRLGTITSYHFDKTMEAYVDDCNGLKLFITGEVGGPRQGRGQSLESNAARPR